MKFDQPWTLPERQIYPNLEDLMEAEMGSRFLTGDFTYRYILQESGTKGMIISIIFMMVTKFVFWLKKKGIHIHKKASDNIPPVQPRFHLLQDSCFF